MKDIILKIENVSHWFGDKKVLYNLNVNIERGQFVSLVGPSGCGKSTLLKSILGTHPPKAGRILVDGRHVLNPSRDIGIVYQHYSLFDFLTVEQNVAFGLMLDETTIFDRLFGFMRWWKLHKQHLKDSRELLEKVGLDGSNHLYPGELSGGMRQRVAIAQALIMRPKILLLDEPFGALDESMREELQDMLLRLSKENREADSPLHTVLIVTHELKEAILVADRVLGLSQHHPEGANGAIFVYDEPAPLVEPDEDRDLLEFGQQMHDIRVSLDRKKESVNATA